MISGWLIAAGAYASWDRLSKVVDWAVVLFGLLLLASVVFSLLCGGMRTMATGRERWVEHKRGKKVIQRGFAPTALSIRT